MLLDFTLGKDDLIISKHAQNFINNFEKANHLSYQEKQNLMQQFKNKLFFCKEIEFGNHTKMNFYNYRIFELITNMQEKRMFNLMNRKLAFIAVELGKNLKHINDKNIINHYYELAREYYKSKDREEKIKFIKDNKKYLPKNFQFPDDWENFRVKSFNRFYMHICYNLTFDPQYLPRPQNETEIENNIIRSKKNSRMKSIHNFYKTNKLSFLTLTLPQHNNNGTLSKDVLNLNKIEPLSKLFMNKLREEIKIYLKQKLRYTKAEIKYFMKKTFKSLKITQIQKSKVIHFHFLFNVDLLKMFGYTNKVYFQNYQNKIFNTEFLENKEYYETESNKKKYRACNGWKIRENTQMIIPNVFKWWADIVRKHIPHLKRLNPRSQNLQIFYRNKDFKSKYKAFKIEIKEMYSKQSLVEKNFSDLVSNYITKYASGLSPSEMSKMIVNNNRLFTGKRLFQFSLSCEPLPCYNSLKYMPFDLQKEKQVLTAFYFNDILKFQDKHILSNLVKNHVMRFNQLPRIKNDNDLNFFNQRQKPLTKTYHYYLTDNATRYFTCYYSSTPFTSLKAQNKYNNVLERLISAFNITSFKKEKNDLKTKIQEIDYYTKYNNYIDPLTTRLIN